MTRGEAKGSCNVNRMTDAYYFYYLHSIYWCRMFPFPKTLHLLTIPSFSIKGIRNEKSNNNDKYERRLIKNSTLVRISRIIVAKQPDFQDFVGIFSTEKSLIFVQEYRKGVSDNARHFPHSGNRLSVIIALTKS